MLRVWTVAGEALAALPPGPEFWFHVVLCMYIYIYRDSCKGLYSVVWRYIGPYRVTKSYVGVHKVYRGMDKKMEATIWGLGLRDIIHQ